jgi:hypothetical protein
MPFFSLFYKIREQAKQVLPEGVGASGGRGRMWGKVWDGEYSANSVHTCM